MSVIRILLVLDKHEELEVLEITENSEIVREIEQLLLLHIGSF